MTSIHFARIESSSQCSCWWFTQYPTWIALQTILVCQVLLWLGHPGKEFRDLSSSWALEYDGSIIGSIRNIARIWRAIAVCDCRAIAVLPVVRHGADILRQFVEDAAGPALRGFSAGAVVFPEGIPTMWDIICSHVLFFPEKVKSSFVSLLQILNVFMDHLSVISPLRLWAWIGTAPYRTLPTTWLSVGRGDVAPAPGNYTLWSFFGAKLTEFWSDSYQWKLREG